MRARTSIPRVDWRDASQRLRRAIPPLRQIGSAVAVSVIYIALHLALDRVSFLQPALNGIDITPWNPHAGLMVALLMVKGLGYTPVALLASALSSQLLPHVSVPPAAGLMGALAIAGGYACASAVLRRMLPERRLQSARDVVLFMAAAIVAAGLVSMGFVAVYEAAGIVPGPDIWEAVFQLWIGDAIGIVVLTPVLLALAERPTQRHQRAPRDDWSRIVELTAQWASIAAALVIVFGFDRYSFQLFYLLFLPLVWIATRHGLLGASWAVVTIQAGLIAALEFTDRLPDTIRTFQLLMFAVAATGLLLGAAVSERRRVARALAESEGRLAAILNTARDGVLAIDADGIIRSGNPAVEQLFALPAQDLIGRDVRDLLAAPHLLQRLAGTAALPSNESVPWELDAWRTDAATFPVEVTTGRFSAQDGERYTIVVRDISARRDAEARARKHEAELAHVSRLSLAGEMASALAHELNQPLTAIAAFGRGCLRLLQQPSTEPALLTDGIEQVVQQAERAGDIISGLREFLRSGSIESSSVALDAIVEAAVALARIEAAQNGIELLVRLAPALPSVKVDRIQIEQVLLNLLRNAMESITGSASTRRVVTIEARQCAPSTVEIAVSDTGSGLAEAVAGRAFDPFVTTKPQGMGLGLSISRSIIEAHGGRLRLVESGASGAVFAFDLPAGEPERRRHGR